LAIRYLVPLEKIARVILFGLLGVMVAVAILFQVLSILHPYSLDYGEAPLVDQAMRLGAGQNIYRADLSAPPYTISNYPPGYVAVLAPVVRWLGPNFWFGRLVSTLSGLASALFLALIIRTLTGDRLAAAASGLLFLSIPYEVKWASYLRIDLLALAFSLAGLALLVRWPQRRSHFLVGALLLVAAIYTRQSYALAAPLAAFVWLLFKNLRRALLLAGIIGGVSLALFLLLNGLTGGGFFYNIVTANVNEFGLERLRWNLRDLGRVAPVLLLIGVATFFLSPRRLPTWALVTPYLVGAGLSALTIGKVGSNINYFLELCAALSLAAGAAVAWSRKYQGSALLRTILFGLLIFQCTKLFDKTLNQYIPELTDRQANLSELRQLEKLVTGTQGPILADEYMSMITLAGRPLEIQPFEVTQLANAGLWDQTPLIDNIQKKVYPLILIHDFAGAEVFRERWTGAMLEAIETNYRIADRLGGTRVYRPIGSRASIDACPGAAWRLPSRMELGVQ
jgi:hypothetical protein